MAYKKVYLKPGKEESLKRFHPWVFSGAIHHIEGEPEEGEIVDVYTSKKEFIACGHFQIGSIAVRVLTFRQKEIDHDFWKHRLEVAYDLRRSLGLAGNPINNTYRLVHGEGDNLPGLIIDVYDHTAVMQAHSAGMHVYRMEIAEALSEVMGGVVQNIYYKSETTLPFKADLEPENGFIKGSEYVIDPEKIGYETCAYIGLYLKDPEQFDSVTEALKKIPEVVECHFTTGQYDMFIKIYAKNNHHLLSIIHDKLQPLGLARSETIISFNEAIKRQMPILNLADED